ncbi:MAG: hypothetical protein HW383_411 [Candidatus Magasanikbacteria bacterium]|nr:hypothetical protein [Candidatus Magasanikbacteria bacterium]
MTNKKQLKVNLANLEREFRDLNKVFADLKMKAKAVMKLGSKQSDALKVAAIRKKLGLK